MILKRLLIPALLALALAACDSSAPVSTSEPAPTAVVGHGKKIVWTDGGSDIQLTSAGQANCAPLSAAEQASALQHSNATRARSGLAPMKLNAKLQKAAQDHACDMANRGTMTHAGTSTKGPAARVKQLGYKPKVTSENIAAGHTSAFGLISTLQQWSASPKHNANIVIPQLSEMGIGRASSADGKTNFWVAVYSDHK